MKLEAKWLEGWSEALCNQTDLVGSASSFPKCNAYPGVGHLLQGTKSSHAHSFRHSQ